MISHDKEQKVRYNTIMNKPCTRYSNYMQVDYGKLEIKVVWPYTGS